MIYEGGLRCSAVHIQSGTPIETDAPTDNQGQGARFSPTDMVATSLATCMATTMGIVARNHGINLDGAKFDVQKIMASNPRRIDEIKVGVSFPQGQQYDDKQKTILETAANTCPVYISLHPDLKKTISWNWL